MTELQDMSDGDLYLLFAQRLAECTGVIKELQHRLPSGDDGWNPSEDSPAQELACVAAHTLLEASQRDAWSGCILCRS